MDELDLVVSPWRNRLREIRRLRERYAAAGGRSGSPASAGGERVRDSGGVFGRGAGGLQQRSSLGFGLGGE